jgi:beta-phosphoglucomutase-like phosphatase (HAD superfamily)
MVCNEWAGKLMTAFCSAGKHGMKISTTEGGGNAMTLDQARFPGAVLFDLDDTISDHQYARRSALAALQHANPELAGQTIRSLEFAHEWHLQATHTLLLAGRLGNSWQHDVLGARNAGIAAIWFNRYDEPFPESSACARVITITRLEPIETTLNLLAV